MPTALSPDESLELWQGSSSPEPHQRSSLSELGKERPSSWLCRPKPQDGASTEMGRGMSSAGLWPAEPEREPEMTTETGVVGAGHLVHRLLSMEDVIDLRIHETSCRCKWATTGAKSLVKALGQWLSQTGVASLINNRLPYQVPEGKPNILPVTGVYQYVQIGVLEIQWHHPPTFVKTLQNKSEDLHAELDNTKISVESTEIGNAVEPTSAHSSQRIMGVETPWPHDISTIEQEGRSFFPQCFLFVMLLRQRQLPKLDSSQKEENTPDWPPRGQIGLG